MFRWFREFMEYSHHMDWLRAHFGDLHSDDGQCLLTEIVNRTTDVDPDSREFRARALREIQSLTKPCEIYGQVVTHPVSHRALTPKVPARLVTFEAVYKHALHCRAAREAHQRSLDKVAKRHPALAKSMGWKGDDGGKSKT
jgi:hypothetical protein